MLPKFKMVLVITSPTLFFSGNGYVQPNLFFGFICIQIKSFLSFHGVTAACSRSVFVSCYAEILLNIHHIKVTLGLKLKGLSQDRHLSPIHKIGDRCLITQDPTVGPPLIMRMGVLYLHLHKVMVKYRHCS